MTDDILKHLRLIPRTELPSIILDGVDEMRKTGHYVNYYENLENGKTLAVLYTNGTKGPTRE